MCNNPDFRVLLLRCKAHGLNTTMKHGPAYFLLFAFVLFLEAGCNSSTSPGDSISINTSLPKDGSVFQYAFDSTAAGMSAPWPPMCLIFSMQIPSL